MELCKRALDRIQIINEDGDVRLCSWLCDGGLIGRLSENSIQEVFNSARAQRIRQMHADKDYSNCNSDACPYVANNNVPLVNVDSVPEFPEQLYLAYENVCNYHCVMCTIPSCQERIRSQEVEDKLNRIDDEVRKVLPYIKVISANGLGELFACKHIMQILKEWKPLAPQEECSVSLETNGSLFNEKNWSSISHLGQYHLRVAVTVLSLEEETYQYLSGTKLPVSNIIENLHFIKKLREKGVIDYFQIATVYQERNFRELPSYVKRCLEEFNPDCVRLRPFEPWGEDTMAEWFRDVRNKYHPYHQEYLEIMKDPIFKDPRVHDWGGGLDSKGGREPYLPLRHRSKLMECVVDEGFVDRIKAEMGDEIVIYGMGTLGKALINVCKGKVRISHCLDRKYSKNCYMDIPVFGVDAENGQKKDVSILISNIYAEDMIEKTLRDMGYTGKIVTISELTGIRREAFM